MEAAAQNLLAILPKPASQSYDYVNTVVRNLIFEANLINIKESAANNINKKRTRRQ